MNEEEFFRILGIEVRESDDETSFYYEEYFYDVETVSPSYDSWTGTREATASLFLCYNDCSHSKLMLSPFTVEQLNSHKDDNACSYNVGKYLHSAAIEAEVADVLRMNDVSEEVINLTCDIIIDHFATAVYLEQNETKS